MVIMKWAQSALVFHLVAEAFEHGSDADLGFDCGNIHGFPMKIEKPTAVQAVGRTERHDGYEDKSALKN